LGKKQKKLGFLSLHKIFVIFLILSGVIEEKRKELTMNQALKINIPRYFYPVLIVFLMMLSGCFFDHEEIRVDPDGHATIMAHVEGDREEFNQAVALPSEPTWQIIEKGIDTDDSESIKMLAKLEIPYGEPFPDSYVPRNSINHEIDLLFPTELKFWREGNKTFYEFKRTYKARKFARYNYDEIDKDLEKKVLEKGVFGVSEQERQKYLQQLQLAFVYEQVNILADVFGAMVLEGNLTVKEKQQMEKKARQIAGEIVTPEKLSDNFKKNKDSIKVTIDRWQNEIFKITERDYRLLKGIPENQSMPNFNLTLERIRREYDITKIIEDRNYSVLLYLPGEVVRTNGKTDPEEEPGAVYWEFDGYDLQDKDIPLYALSVIEH
jgi:hypothetical protein